MVAPVTERFLSLPFPQRKTAEKRQDYFIKDCPLVDWQTWGKVYSRTDAAQPPIFQFANDGKVWLKGSQLYTKRPKEPTALDRIFQSFLGSRKPGLAALTVILGMEWQIPDPRGSRLAARENIFTAWLKQLDAASRGELAAEGFTVAPGTVFDLAAGRLTLKIEALARCGEMFKATRTIAAAGLKAPDRMDFDAIDPFYVSELSAYYFADVGIAALEKGEVEAALAAFRLAEVVTPGHTVIGKLIAEKMKAGLPRF